MSEHPSIDMFDVAEDCLAVGGVRLDRLADRVGTTPFFAYDRRLITARVAYLRSVLPRDVKLSYAVKANPMPAVVQHIAGLVDAFDVASAFEMKTALDTVVPASNISFAGPGKTSIELTQAIAAGVTIEMESESEASRIIEAGNRLGIRPRVALRVNPNFQVKGSGMKMGGGRNSSALMPKRCRLCLENWQVQIWISSDSTYSQVRKIFTRIFFAKLSLAMSNCCWSFPESMGSPFATSISVVVSGSRILKRIVLSISFQLERGLPSWLKPQSVLHCPMRRLSLSLADTSLAKLAFM